MGSDPRLVARSETDQGTRVVRPEASRPDRPDVLLRVPDVDVDELIRARDGELASEMQWRVRIDRQHLWWAAEGGYTSFLVNARRWASRWDAYNDMLRLYSGARRWEIEEVERRAFCTAGFASAARRGDLSQAWTRVLPSAPGARARPGDGVVHALTGENMPGWALCGEQVTFWAAPDWPPRAMRRCERCNSIALTLPD